MLTEKDIRMLYADSRKTMCQADADLFIRLLHTVPDRLKFLPKPLPLYAGDRPRVRIKSGVLAGLEGYVVRITRDRKLVTKIGPVVLAVGGVHGEEMEEVAPHSS